MPWSRWAGGPRLRSPPLPARRAERRPAMATGAEKVSAIVTVAYKPTESASVPLVDQLRVQKGDVVHVLHQDFDTQWWECRMAIKAPTGDKWDPNVHVKVGMLPSGTLLVRRAVVLVEESIYRRT